jgi:hypothetical protein
VVASPAPSFFSIPTVVSRDPEVPGIAPPSSREQTSITNLVAAGPNGNWTDQLGFLEIKYVVVVHELDWQSYRYLDRQPGLVKIADFDTITVYRINQSSRGN